MADIPAIRITAIDEATAVIGRIGNAMSGLRGVVESLGVGLSVASFANWTAQTIKATSDLEKFAAVAGTTVESMSKMSAPARVAGVSMEELATMSARLAKNLVEASGGSGKAAEALASLGFNATDVGRMLKADMGDNLQLIAERMITFKNNTAKAGTEMQLLGRGGATTAAFMKELAEQTDRTASVTTEQAAQAHELMRQWAQVQEIFENMSRASAMALIPALRDITKALTQIGEQRGSTVAFFTEVGTFLKLTAASAIITYTAFKDLGIVIAGVGAIISTMGTPGGLSEAKTIWKEMVEDMEANEAAGRSFIKTLDVMGEHQESSARKTAAGTKEITTQSAAFAEAEKLYTSLADKIQKEIDTRTKTTHAIWLENIARASNADTLAEGLKNLEAIISEQENFKRITDQLVESEKEFGDAFSKAVDPTIAAGRALGEFMLQLRDQALTAGLSADAVDELRLKMLMLHADIKEGYEIWTNYLEAFKAWKTELAEKNSLAQAAHDAEEEWKHAARAIEDALVDAFMQVIKKGKNAMEAFKNLLYDMFKTLVLKPILQPVAQGVAGAFSGLAGGTGGAGLGGAWSWLTSALGLGSFSGGAGSGILGTIGTSFANLNLAMTAGVDSIGGFSAALTAAAPAVLTLVAVAGYMLYQYLESKKGGPKIGGYAEFGVTRGGSYFPGEGTTEGDASMKAFAEATGKAYAYYNKKFGGSGGAGFAFGFDTDPQGKAPSNVHAGVFMKGLSIADFMDPNVGRTSEELKTALDLAAKRALIAALAASDLPGKLGEVFSRIDVHSITVDVADNLLTFAEAYQTLTDVFNANPMDDALTAIADAALGAQAALEKQGKALLDLIDTYDGTGQATDDLAKATQAYYANVVTLIAQIEQLKTQIKDMFASSIKTYTFSKLDTSGKYKYLQDEAAALYEELKTSSDANRINALAQMIDADMREAFGLLTPEQQAQMADQFIKGAKETSEQAAERLAKVQKEQEEKMNAVLTSIKTALEDAADKIMDGGLAVEDGGNSIKDAAAALINAASVSLVNG